VIALVVNLVLIAVAVAIVGLVLHDANPDEFN
jgi:hypothetical protein